MTEEHDIKLKRLARSEQLDELLPGDTVLLWPLPFLRGSCHERQYAVATVTERAVGLPKMLSMRTHEGMILTAHHDTLIHHGICCLGNAENHA